MDWYLAQRPHGGMQLDFDPRTRTKVPIVLPHVVSTPTSATKEGPREEAQAAKPITVTLVHGNEEEDYSPIPIVEEPTPLEETHYLVDKYSSFS